MIELWVVVMMIGNNSRYHINNCGVVTNPDVLLSVRGAKDYTSFHVRGAFLNGMWHVGVSISTSQGGCGYGVSPKWGRIAPTKEEAVRNAVEEFRAFMKDNNFTKNELTAKVERAYKEFLQCHR